MRQRNEKEQLTLHGSLVDSVEIEHTRRQNITTQNTKLLPRGTVTHGQVVVHGMLWGQRIGPDGQRAAAPTDREAAGLHVPARGQVVSPHGDVEMHARSR
ncbi:hypothetical protein S7711_10426 [Stachybotrys chartarum IBT 7711]|uniref:Uncharacterized protein n=1 Tax=Stachybotrys chartarum (strain CBS 109288 / IBT 7711) TaxID=1280523 RepID=A0A084ASV3_STACB|nr:hypothetical protein S7711_10426 [Stachybotrys chartarum IBT 7711]